MWVGEYLARYTGWISLTTCGWLPGGDILELKMAWDIRMHLMLHCTGEVTMFSEQSTPFSFWLNSCRALTGNCLSNFSKIGSKKLSTQIIVHNMPQFLPQVTLLFFGLLPIRCTHHRSHPPPPPPPPPCLPPYPRSQMSSLMGSFGHEIDHLPFFCSPGSGDVGTLWGD